MNEESLKAAVELHRPVGYDRFGLETADPSAAVQWRCRGGCDRSVPADGCLTWRTANGQQ